MKKNLKKSLVFSSLIAALPLVLTACSNSATSPVTGGQAASSSGARSARQIDFGQPDRPADLRGVVTSVVGSEVNILKIAVNSGRRASSTPERNSSSTNPNPTNPNSPSVSLSGVAATGSGNRGGFIGGRGAAGGPGGGTADRAAMIASLKAMSTGQETITIPVGIKMMKFSVDPSTQKRTAVEANLTDISADKMITVWLNSSITDKKIADFVLIN